MTLAQRSAAPMADEDIQSLQDTIPGITNNLSLFQLPISKGITL
jgi:hypothetical protein